MRKPPVQGDILKDGQAGGQLSLPCDIKKEVTDLYKSFSASLLSYVLCLVRDFDLAQEAVQETFLRYYEYRLNNQDEPVGRGWFFRVARNYTIDRLREAKTENIDNLNDEVSNPPSRKGPYETFAQLETIRRLSKSLTSREFECLQLRAEGFKYREIAQIMSIKPGTVGATLSSGFKKIRALESNKQKAD